MNKWSCRNISTTPLFFYKKGEYVVARNITSEIIKKYCSVDETENGDSTLFCMVKWNGREPKGYDIRKYSKENDTVYKGITLSYDALDEIVITAIKEGLVDIIKVRDAVDAFDNRIFSQNDFKKMFNKIDDEVHNYKRDKHGYLRDDDGRIVISKRIK